MYDFGIFLSALIGCVITVAIAGSIIFKNSFLRKFSILLTGIAAFIALLGYVIAGFGNVHILWAAPAGIGVLVYYFLVMEKEIRRPMNAMSSSIGKLSEGDINIDLDDRYLSRKNEIGLVFKKLEEFIQVYNAISALAVSIGEGKLETDYQIRGENDAVGKALLEMKGSLSAGISEVQNVIETVLQNGDLAVRIRTSGKLGAWKELGDVVNQLLSLLSGPLHQVNNVVHGLSKGDLTNRYDQEAKGDLAQLKNNLNHAIHELEQLLTSVKIGASLINGASSEMSALSSEMSASTEEVTSSINEMSTGAGTQMQKIDEASLLVEAMRTAAVGMSEKANGIHALANEGSKQSSIGSELVKEISESMVDITTSADLTKQAMEVLEDKSKKISSVLDVISGISSQTNLLALNAAIEAAQAGEAGRGFAVVAEEIRKLAEDSKISAVEIERLVDEIKNDTISASNSTAEMVVQIVEGKRKSDLASDAFDKLYSATTQTLNSSKEIVGASNLQTEKINEIFSIIQNVVVIAEETAAGSEEIASAASQLASGMNNFNEKALEFSEVSNSMMKASARFILSDLSETVED